MDVFHGLTDNQIELFGERLAKDSEFGGRYAKVGESMENFLNRMRLELQDIEKQKLYLPYLVKLGFKGK